MKHTHFDIDANGFYGAYWECKCGADCAIIAMLGDAPPSDFFMQGKKDGCKEWPIEGESLFSYRYAENMAEACKQNAKFTGRRQLLSTQYFLKIFFNFNFDLIAFDCSCYKSQ